MFRNYLVTALRNLWKKKLFTAINVIGLSVGMTCFFLIAVNVLDEFSYDNFHPQGDRLYRVALERIYPDNVVNFAVIPFSIGEAMRDDFPEVERMTRAFKFGQPVAFRYQDRTFEESSIMMAETGFFELFGIRLLEGDPDQVLAGQNNVILTRDTAIRYFGDEEAVGKQISFGPGELQVSGVCENVPENSHLDFDMLGNLGVIGLDRRPNYVSFSVHTYVRLREGVSPAEIEEKMPALVERYAAGQIKAQTGIDYRDYIAAGNGYRYFLQPVRGIHLHSNLSGEIEPNANINYVYILIAIAVFLIFIACVNFMNLSTARAAGRAREVGIRKIVGSVRGQLVRQFLVESLSLSLVSMAVAAALAQLILPLFNNLARKRLTLGLLQKPELLVFLLALGVAVGLLAGLYPAFALSAYRPVVVLKGRFSTSRRGIRVRNGLVVFQFAVSVVLMAMTLMVSRQMDYMRNKDLGFNPDNLLVVDRGGVIGRQGEAFKQELLALPGVAAASGSNTLIQGGDYYGVMFRTEQDSEVRTTRAMTIDDDFIPTMGIEILSGRGFSREFDDTWNVLINQAAIREFGWTDPVGMKLRRRGAEDEITGDYTVVGVFRDFHYESLHRDIDSFVLFSMETQRELNRIQAAQQAAREGRPAPPSPEEPTPLVFPRVNVRMRPGNTAATLEAVEEVWKKFSPQQPFNAFFLDDRLEEYYHNERSSGRIFSVFSVLAILIACIGLFGLSAFTAEQRTKEIGIRKVLGSTVSKVVVLLSRDFARLVALAFLVGVPVAYYVIIRWQRNFSFRAAVPVWIFLAAGAAALLIAQATISLQVFRAARADPADSIRFE